MEAKTALTFQMSSTAKLYIGPTRKHILMRFHPLLPREKMLQIKQKVTYLTVIYLIQNLL
jgi:hypothetical protein